MSEYNERLKTEAFKKLMDACPQLWGRVSFSFEFFNDDQSVRLFNPLGDRVDLGYVADVLSMTTYQLISKLEQLTYNWSINRNWSINKMEYGNDTYKPEKISPKEAGNADGQLWNSFIGPDRVHDQSTVFMIGSNFAKQKGYTDVDSNNDYTFQFIKCFKVGQYSAPEVKLIDG